MLDRQKGNFIVECDKCSEVLDTETSSFDSALNIMRRNGWKSRKIGEDWVHWCGECK